MSFHSKFFQIFREKNNRHLTQTLQRTKIRHLSQLVLCFQQNYHTKTCQEYFKKENYKPVSLKDETQKVLKIHSNSTPETIKKSNTSQLHGIYLLKKFKVSLTFKGKQLAILSKRENYNFNRFIKTGIKM